MIIIFRIPMGMYAEYLFYLWQYMISGLFIHSYPTGFGLVKKDIWL